MYKRANFHSILGKLLNDTRQPVTKQTQQCGTVADLEGAEPAPTSPIWAMDRRRHGTSDKWKRYSLNGEC